MELHNKAALITATVAIAIFLLTWLVMHIAG